MATEFWRGRRVLVTGHTGFKGSWLGLWLTQLGAEVSGLALAPDTTPDLFTASGLERRLRSRFGDVRDREAVEAALSAAQPEIVFHLAAQALVRRSYADPAGTFATNVMGTVHVLDAARRVDSIRAVVVVTSDKCYENREWWWPYREDDALGGHDPYSSSKAGAELVTAAWRRSFFTDGTLVGVASARAGNVIGGGDWSADRLVPDCMRAFSERRPAVIRHPHAARPWQHVLEPLAGYLTLAERLVAEPGEFGEAWNFGPSAAELRTVGWIAERLRTSWGDDAAWVADAAPNVHEAGRLHVDASKARARLGWEPRMTLEEAFDWTIDWYRRHAAGEDAATLAFDQIRRYEQRDQPR